MKYIKLLKSQMYKNKAKFDKNGIVRLSNI